jgi:hypothetical protein
MRNNIRSSRLKAGRILFLLLMAGPGLRAQQEGEKLLVRVSAGYERQDFRWSIAGNSAGQDPNVYSELKWHGVGGPSGKVDLQWKPWRRWRIFASGSRVFNRAGSFTDTDYGLDNRYDPIYHQQFDAGTGYREAASAGIGYLLGSGRWRLTPFIGYGIDVQYFPIVDPGGPFDELNSSYSAKWLGPLLRVEAAWQLSGRWQVVADATYRQVKYHATADWNLIQAFAQPVSFRHMADGYGVEAGAGLRYTVGRRIAIELRGGYFNWQTGTGIDQLYLSAGGSDETQLNGVVREGWKATLGVEVGVF